MVKYETNLNSPVDIYPSKTSDAQFALSLILLNENILTGKFI